MITKEKQKQYLKILGFKYEIKIVEPNEMNEGLDGICDDTNLTILVKRNKIMVSTLIHEIIEAINTNMDFQWDHDRILQLETSLRSILLDNNLLNLKKINEILGKK